MTQLCALTEHRHGPDAPRGLAGRLICEPMRGIHLDNCADTKCRGCMPRLAETSSRTCTRCHLLTGDRIAELGLPSVYYVTDPDTGTAYRRVQESLYDALLAPTRAGPAAKSGKGAERGETLPTSPREARTQARMTLVAWCYLLHEEPGYQVDVPANTVPAMVKHLAAYLRRILAGEHAERFVIEIAQRHHEARRSAYPQAPTGYSIGECPLPDPNLDAETIELTRRAGGPVPLCSGVVRASIDTLDGEGWAACLNCGSRAVIGWWQERMPVAHPEYMGMRDLRWHLAVVHGLQVTEGTVRGWANRQQLATKVDPARPQRVEYDVEQAIWLARRRRVGRPKKATA